MNDAGRDIRDAFFDEIYELAVNDKNLIFLSADADTFSLIKFRRDFPERFINVGVAEQNMVTLATGLALAGKKVFIYALLPFVTMRCYEQIKFNLCSMNLPVTLIGVGVGYSFEFDGPSHHGVTDLGILRALPEMTIINPASANAAAWYARYSYLLDGPSCVRLDKGVLPEIYNKSTGFDSGLNVVKEGVDLCIVATGRLVQTAITVRRHLKKNGIAASVIDLHRIKPIDSDEFLKVIGPFNRVITLEEHSIVGGIGSAVAEIFVDNEIMKPLNRIALPDIQCFEVGSREWLMRCNGLDTASIVSRIEAWGKKITNSS
jgi:transketolase